MCCCVVGVAFGDLWICNSNPVDDVTTMVSILVIDVVDGIVPALATTSNRVCTSTISVDLVTLP